VSLEVSRLLPKRRPSGLPPGKNLRAAVSLMIATFGAALSSRTVKARPVCSGIPIVSKKFGPVTIWFMLRSRSR
jgi:hypothetical protein